MSASLVGSEMCIRDRVDDAPGHQAPPTPGGTLLGGAREGRARRGGGRAVSYTHLTLPTICSV
eukprot:10194154-Alexandrium_andersonii.AAC.1